MPHRDDLEAAHARIAALERELAAARKQGRAPLRCASCRGAFSTEDLDRISGRLTCRNCRAAIDTGRPPRPPRDLEIDDTPENLCIRWNWQPSLRGFFATLLFGGITLLALVRGREPTGLQTFALVALGTMALLFAYLFVQSLVNHTFIQVDSRQLSIESGPLALKGRLRVLKAADIDQLYVVMLSARSSVWYSLNARMAGRAPVVLVGGIDEVERAFYLERALEHRLGIADRPVEGEVPRRPPDAAGQTPTESG